MLTLKHLITLRHVSILIDHCQGVHQCLVKVTEFYKKSLSLKFIKVNHGDVAAFRGFVGALLKSRNFKKITEFKIHKSQLW